MLKAFKKRIILLAFFLFTYSPLRAEITPIPDIDQPFSKRKTSRYLINDIWSEEELENKWNQLSERHGLDLFSRARALAVQINEPCDPDVVSSFIILIEMYGEELVNKAIDRATSLSFENEKWEMRYIIGILKSEYVRKPSQRGLRSVPVRGVPLEHP